MKNKESSSTKVGFVTNIYTPYKEAMFREMAKLLDLKVYYCAEREVERKWAINFSGKYDYEVIPGKTFQLGKRKLHFNPTLPQKIERDAIDVMIIGEWANPTVASIPFWLRMKGIPRILWSGSTELEFSYVRYITDPIKRLIIAQYQGYVCYTNRAADYVNKLGADFSKIYVAPVTVDTDFFKKKSEAFRNNPGRNALRDKYNIKKNEVGIVFVGQLTHRKGVDLLINAVNIINNSKIKVLLAGTGPNMAEFKNLVAKFNLEKQFTFLGHCSQLELVELYAACDLFTLPSRKDPSGNVINEAMTVGLPVVISDQIGCDCVNHEKNGYIFQSEDINNYAKFLSKLVDNKEPRLKMGKQAKKNILENFSIQIEANEFAKAIKNTMVSLNEKFSPLRPIDSCLNSEALQAYK